MHARVLEELKRPLSGALVAVLYVLLGLTDMVLSHVAFSLGILEGNPLLAWLLPHGLFVPAKLGLTALVGILIVALYPHTRGRRVAAGAVLLMTAVDIYHIISLNLILSR